MRSATGAGVGTPPAPPMVADAVASGIYGQGRGGMRAPATVPGANRACRACGGGSDRSGIAGWAAQALLRIVPDAACVRCASAAIAPSVLKESSMYPSIRVALLAVFALSAAQAQAQKAPPGCGALPTYVREAMRDVSACITMPNPIVACPRPAAARPTTRARRGAIPAARPAPIGWCTWLPTAPRSRSSTSATIPPTTTSASARFPEQSRAACPLPADTLRLWRRRWVAGSACSARGALVAAAALG